MFICPVAWMRGQESDAFSLWLLWMEEVCLEIKLWFSVALFQIFEEEIGFHTRAKPFYL